MPTQVPVIQVVGAAIIQSNTCLVAQRGPGGKNAFQWEFPGGKVEPAEGLRAALRREILEELEVEIEVVSWLGRGRDVSPFAIIELDVFVARIVCGDVRLAEHHRFGWFQAEEVDALHWASADRPILPALKDWLNGT